MDVTRQSDPAHSKTIPALIGKLLAERQKVLVSFNRLALLKPYREAEGSGDLCTLLQQFCQVLVDYVALGHFEVYQALEDHPSDSERCKHARRLARTLYPCIALTTQEALDFNDRYTEPDHTLARLSADLSRLGERLAERIEAEDRLIMAVTGPLPAAEVAASDKPVAPAL